MVCEVLCFSLIALYIAKNSLLSIGGGWLQRPVVPGTWQASFHWCNQQLRSISEMLLPRPRINCAEGSLWCFRRSGSKVPLRERKRVYIRWPFHLALQFKLD